METVKRLFISLIVLLGCSAGAWAIEQDSEGYYLIGSVQDWKDFAAIVETTPNANARMIADIDLGDVQTMIGTSSSQFKGIFDGLGYSISVNYSTSSVHSLAPFQTINGATIKNIVVDGTIAGFMHCSGLVGYADGNNLISNVIVKATITTTGSHCGGILGHGAYSSTTIKDCLFAGTINGANGNATVGAIWGWSDGGSPVIINCLENGSYNNCSPFAPIFISYSGGPTVTNSYYVNGSSAYGTQVTATMLTDGSVVEGLNNGRTGDDAPWVQDPLTKQPTLKIFATLKQDADGYYLIGSVQDWKNFAELVNSGTNTAANAKMTADVDLGDDQTMIGTVSVPYQGTFDGQGHKLNIAYDVTENYVAPFRVVNGATIQNLEVAGTINTTAEYAGGLLGYSPSSSTASNVTMCRSSVNIVGHSTISGRTDWHGGFVGLVYTPVHFTDCLSDGKITGSSSPAQSFCTGFIGLTRGGTSTFTNCLNNCELHVYATNGLWHFIGGTGSVTNSYVNNTINYTSGYSQASSVTEEQLSNGTVTTYLQKNRSEEIWVQDPVLGIPMLKIFANEETEPPSDALNGVFTINASGEKVSFAKGNLQKIGSTYQFAEHQYDYFGKNQSDTQRDMFSFNNFSTPNSDDNWFNMTHDQWVYLLRDRSVNNSLSDGACFTMATLGGTYKGVILFPDNYTHPEGTGFTPGVFNSYSNYTAQVSLEGWALMEAAGCVFLPSCGWKSKGNEWKSVGETAVYSSTTVCSDDVTHFYTPCFYVDRINFDGWCHRESWAPVRLVMRLQPLTYTVPSSGVGTFSSEVNIHLPEGLNAHYCKTYYAERSAISVVNISSGVVPANTGVLLSGTPGETFNLYPTPETADELEGNALVAVVESQHIAATDGDHTNFMMSGGKFIRIADDGEDVKMPANRAYLPLLTEAISGSNAKEIMLYWGTTTGIESLASSTPSKGEGSIYNLNGQKLSSPLKGINIINGRKVIVK